MRRFGFVSMAGYDDSAWESPSAVPWVDAVGSGFPASLDGLAADWVVLHEGGPDAG